MGGVVGSAGDSSVSSHVDGYYGMKTFLALSLKYAQTVNQSSCWLCTHTPFTAIGGIPLGVIPFTQSEMLGFGNMPIDSRDSCLIFGVQPLVIEGLTPLTSVTRMSLVQVGWSQCSQIADLAACDGNEFFLCTMSANLTLSNVSVAAFHANALGNIGSTGMVAPNGTYFICGPNAYVKLSPFWMGSCYLVPHIRHSVEPPFAKLHRRSIFESEQFFAISFPFHGMAKLARVMISMASSLEALINLTADGFTAVLAEMVAMRTVAMQNRVALDYLLAPQGCMCSVIGTECCTYIPDETDGVLDLADKIREEGAKFHNYNFDDMGLMAWLSSVFGKWGTFLFKLIAPIVACVMVFCLLVQTTKIFLDSLCRLCSDDHRNVYNGHLTWGLTSRNMICAR
uniref:Uncharacterized protein n=1 Tax=Esox lucius TaxID=8010 RepID=A0AAY5KDC8_ESOLU